MFLFFVYNVSMTKIKTKIFARCGIMWFEVFVLETRNVYGREQCLVTPVNGNGQEWKDFEGLIYAP